MSFSGRRVFFLFGIVSFPKFTETGISVSQYIRMHCYFYFSSKGATVSLKGPPWYIITATTQQTARLRYSATPPPHGGVNYLRVPLVERDQNTYLGKPSRRCPVSHLMSSFASYLNSRSRKKHHVGVEGRPYCASCFLFVVHRSLDDDG